MTTILVIDDDAGIRRMLRVILENAGHEVVEARAGSEGVRMYHRYHPALIITDMIMPLVTGNMVLRELARLGSTAKLIAMSGQVTREFLDLTKRYGVSETLRKPFRRDALLAAVARLLEPVAVSLGAPEWVG
jgi:DNA-binding NtrC family response regulator